MEKLLLKGNPIGEINGILFDKDGTLINSEDRLFFLSQSRVEESIKLFTKQGYSSEVINQLKDLLFKAYGLSKKTVNPNGSVAIASRQDNLITTATVFCILGKHWSNAIQDANNVFDKTTKKYLSIKNNLTKETLLPGLIAFLNQSKKKNIKLGLISNDSRNGIKEFLKDKEIEVFFPIFWSSEDHPPKPNPDAIKKLCALMNIKPSECALIGDADTDMRMASRGNIALALGYTAGWETSPLIYEHHHLISHWDELTFQ